ARDVPDTRLIELVEGPDRLAPGRALDLGCGAGRNTLYLARSGWEAIGIDMIVRAIDKSRSRAVGAAASARFVLGDVSRLGDVDIGAGYRLINDSGCYYGLTDEQRDGFAAGVTRVAAPDVLLLMAGFTKIPGRPGINEDDLRRRFTGWQIRTTALVPVEEIMRHTSIPLPMRAWMKRGRLQIRRFELCLTA
ncbi:MAG: class I SAM-dependent methyltransferase, partial [Mycobacterium sp.]